MGSLDEADLRTYILEHERGSATLIAPISIGLLLRHTDGIPARIDRTLKELEVVTLSELLNSDADIVATKTSTDTSPSLAKSINELAESEDVSRQRSYALLKTLSLFPQGEQLTRIKRFYLNAPFFPQHATDLLDRALIEVTTVQGLEAGTAAPLAKTLVVPRQVREYVRDLMGADETGQLNHRAAEIYFGTQWLAGTFKFPTNYKFDDPHCGTAEIGNANTIILRLLRGELATEKGQNTSRVLALAEFYLRALLDGSHYNSAAVFCEDLVPIIPSSGFDDKLAAIRSCASRSVIQKAPQLPAPARMLQLPRRLGLDLTNALARHRELLADFFQSVIGVHADAEAHAQHALLATAGERAQRVKAAQPKAHRLARPICFDSLPE